MNNHTFRMMTVESEIADCATLLRVAFSTVAADFALTEETVPSNAAFATAEKLRDSLRKPVELHGLFVDDAMIGCVAIEKASGNAHDFYIERLAVIPESRHQGYGDKLLLYACERIREKDGSRALIGLMDNNVVLKAWYKSKGFRQNECRTFAHLPFKVCFMSKDL